MADGRVVVPVVTADRVIDPGGTAFTPELNLVFLRPDGTTDVQTVSIDDLWDDAAYPFKAVPNGEGGVLVAWDRVTPGISGVYPYDAMLTRVAMDGTRETTADLGDTWSGPAGFGSLVLSEENTILATAYVHDLSNWPTVVPRLNTVTLLLPNGYPITSGDYGVLDVTSVLAASGGGGFGSFVVSLSDGTVAGSDPGFAQMNLADAQYGGQRTWIGASSGSFASVLGPLGFQNATAWASQGALRSANAAARVCPNGDADLNDLVNEYPYTNRRGPLPDPNCDDFDKDGAGNNHLEWKDLNGRNLFDTHGLPDNEHEWAMVRNSVRAGIDRVWNNVPGGVRVTSVYRSPHGNARHSTAVSSGHLWGVGADFKYPSSSSGKMPRPQFDALRAVVLDEARGAAVYSEEYELHGTHVHGGFEWWPGTARFEAFLSQ